MIAGAVSMAPHQCKVEGCSGRIVGRRMCDKHYKRWRRANPDLTMMAITRQTILDAMPGTIPRLVEKTGMRRETILRALAVLNVAGPARQAYIYDWEPPMAKGKNWQPMYRQGAGPNKRLTKQEKTHHRRAMEIAWRTKHGKRPADPVARASWASALGAA